MEQNGFSFLPFLIQMTSNAEEAAPFTYETGQEMTEAMFDESCLDGQYNPVVQMTAYMDTM